MRHLGVLGAGEEVVLHIDHVGEALGVLPHRRHVHDAADVDAAVAHEDPDPGEFFRADSLSGRLFLDQGRPAGRQTAMALAPAAAAEASMTDSGMSLGPWMAPHT